MPPPSRRRGFVSIPKEGQTEREREIEQGKPGEAKERVERKKLRTERRGVIVLFFTPFEVVVLSALCSSSQVFFL